MRAALYASAEQTALRNYHYAFAQRLQQQQNIQNRQMIADAQHQDSASSEATPPGPPPQPPAPTPEDIRVTVVRGPNEKLGIAVHVVLEEDLLLVQQVHPGGLIEAWNIAHPEAKVSRGDWIVSVNTEQESGGSMFAQLQREGRLEIVFSKRQPHRPNRRREHREGEPVRPLRRLAVSLEKGPGQVLGAQVTVGRQGYTISEIYDGVIKEWNVKSPAHEIRVGDRIVFVNGVRKEDMLTELGKPGTLHLVLQRGPPRSNSRNTLRSAAVAQLPRTVVGPEMVCEGDACGICLEEWALGEEAMQLPCMHLFHPDCATPWLTKHSALCPLCGWAADHDKGRSFDVDTDVAAFEGTDYQAPQAQSVPKSQAIFGAGMAQRRVEELQRLVEESEPPLHGTMLCRLMRLV